MKGNEMAQAIHAMVSDHETVMVTRSADHALFMMHLITTGQSIAITIPESDMRELALAILRWTGKRQTAEGMTIDNEPTISE